MDKHDGDAPADLLRKSLRQNRELLTTFNRAWPLLEAADLVGDLWSVPAYLRKCAPWLSPDEVAALQREDAQAWTVSDLPLLDAARQRLGDPEASRRRRRHEAAVAAERERMAKVVDDLIATDDSEMLVMSMLRGQDLQDALVDETALPSRRPGPARRPVRARRRGRGSGTDRRGVADAAAALPVPELHHRRGPRPGPARVHRVVAGTARADRARPDHPGLPDASTTGRRKRSWPKPSRSSGPCSRTPTCRPPSAAAASPSSTELRRSWARSSTPGSPRTPTGSPASSAIPTFRATSRVRSLTPELSKGLEFDLVVLIDPEAFGDGHRRSGRPLCRDDPSDPATRHPHELLTGRSPADRVRCSIRA